MAMKELNLSIVPRGFSYYRMMIRYHYNKLTIPDDLAKSMLNSDLLLYKANLIQRYANILKKIKS